MYNFKTNINIKEYETFLKQNDASFMQEKNWANVKDNWDNILCGVYSNNKLVAACSVLIRKITKKISMFYIPRGYVIDFENIELLKFMTDNIKKLAKEKHAYTVKIDPYFCRNEYLVKNMEYKFNYLSKNFDNKHNNLISLGYKHRGFNKNMHDNFQPQYNMAIPLINENNEPISYEQLLKSFKSKVRYYLGDFHKKRGVFFTHSYDKKDIKKLVEMLEHTEKNKNIHLRNEEYFNKIITNFKGRTCLIFGKINLEEYLEFLKNNNGAKEEIKKVETLLEENEKIITLSGSLLLLPDTTSFKCSEYLYAGNNILFNKLNISGGVPLEAARISIENNCQYCNLGGVDGNLNDSLSNFKSKYNAVVLEFAGEYDLIINKPLYLFTEKFKPLLKKFYKIIKK